MLNYILRGHDPILEGNVLRWAKWFGTADRVVKKTKVSRSVNVSTVFLGIDHNFGNLGNPVLFETMVFGGDRDSECRRYCTWDEAVVGHDEIVRSF